MSQSQRLQHHGESRQEHSRTAVILYNEKINISPNSLDHIKWQQQPHRPVTHSRNSMPLHIWTDRIRVASPNAKPQKSIVATKTNKEEKRFVWGHNQYCQVWIIGCERKEG